MHTAEIVTGYQRAYEKTLEILPELVVKSVGNVRDPVQLKMAIKSVLATKQYGYEDMLSELVVKACLITLPPNSKNPKLNLDSVRIAKLRGGNLNLSSVVKGMVIIIIIIILLLLLLYYYYYYYYIIIIIILLLYYYYYHIIIIIIISPTHCPRSL